MDWFDLLAVQETLKILLPHHSSKASVLWHSAFFRVQFSHPYMTTGKTIALTRWTFVGKVMSLLFNMLSKFVIGEGNGSPVQYSCWENPVDRGAWWAAVPRVAQSRTRLKRLSMHACIGEGNGNPLQYSCIENPRDGGAWWAAVYGVAQSWTRLKPFSSSSRGTFLSAPAICQSLDTAMNRPFLALREKKIKLKT